MIQFIDGLHLGRPQVIGTGVLGTDQLALFDCGPESVVNETVAALRRLGLRPENVTHVFVTHIHFDHAGAAWRWAVDYGATICVHPFGAPHLADPTKLLASATQIFGDQMGRLWGEMRAVPVEKLRVIADGEEIAAGGSVVRALDTPGHARHHHAWWIEAERTVFAGDVMGVSINGGPCLPPCPPPDINVEQWLASLNKLMELRPARAFITHFGELDHPAKRLNELAERLLDWAEWIAEELKIGMSEEKIISLFEQRVWSELKSAGLSDEAVETYEQADPAAMSVGGLARYWRKFRPDALR
ncbi:MAG: MBL fold metallo-hydrolase [Candidatus Didemnitutus sp.]|nr:MBL fold metallo-hydrolase [Candidatus Didemnitutus sp.]